MYDLVSGRQLLKSSYVVGKKKALELFPMLKKDKLCGAIIYYDGESCTKLIEIKNTGYSQSMYTVSYSLIDRCGLMH